MWRIVLFPSISAFDMGELTNRPSFRCRKISEAVSARMSLIRESSCVFVAFARSLKESGPFFRCPAISSSAATRMQGRSQKYWKCSYKTTFAGKSRLFSFNSQPRKPFSPRMNQTGGSFRKTIFSDIITRLPCEDIIKIRVLELKNSPPCPIAVRLRI